MDSENPNNESSLSLEAGLMEGVKSLQYLGLGLDLIVFFKILCGLAFFDTSYYEFVSSNCFHESVLQIQFISLYSFPFPINGISNKLSVWINLIVNQFSD